MLKVFWTTTNIRRFDDLWWRQLQSGRSRVWPEHQTFDWEALGGVSSTGYFHRKGLLFLPAAAPGATRDLRVGGGQ